jgi:tetratricopeptide (TPR) repeat protein
LHRALSLSPDDRGLLLEVAELYRVRGQPQRALAMLQHLADTYPPGEEPQQTLYLMGLAYAALERYDDAIESLYAASARSKPTAEILYALAESESRAGQPSAAESNVRQALAIDPGHEPSRALYTRLEQARRPTHDATYR